MLNASFSLQLLAVYMQGTGAAASAIVFAHNSTLNESFIGSSTKSSTAPEILAIARAISWANKEGVKDIVISTDSSSAILLSRDASLVPFDHSPRRMEAVKSDSSL